MKMLARTLRCEGLLLRERGDIAVIMAFFLTGVLVLFAALVDLTQIRQAQVMVETAVQAAAADGARGDIVETSIIPRCPPGWICVPHPRRLWIPDAEVVSGDVRRSLEANLESVAYLMDGVTPAQVAAGAEIVVVNPEDGECAANPLSGNDSQCYWDPFVAVRATVPMKALWGATSFQYRVMVVGALTDNVGDQAPATPIPTPTVGPYPTWPVPRPTCPPAVCG